MSRAEVCCATIRRQAEIVELRAAGVREIDAAFGGAVPAGLHVKILLRYTARRMTSSPPMTADELIALLDGEGLLGPAASRDALRQSVFGARREVAASDFATLLFRRWRETGGLGLGFMAHDWRFGHETDDIIEEFSDMLVGEPLTMRQTAVKGPRIHVRLATPDGQGRTAVVDCSEEGLVDVVSAVNGWLVAAGAAKRLFNLPTSGDWNAVLAGTPERHAMLLARGALG